MAVSADEAVRSGQRVARITGAAAITEMLECIGASDTNDHDVARILVDHEMAIRALMTFALTKLAEHNP